MRPPGLEPVQTGSIVDVHGATLRAAGIRAQLGELCELSDPRTRYHGHAEVTGFGDGLTVLSPFGDTAGLGLETRVRPLGHTHRVAVGDFLLGRVVDGLGRRYLDRQETVISQGSDAPVWRQAPPPLSRPRISSPMMLGVRALDGLLTMGVGQRVGIFAPAGCGKSTLLSMISRHAQADVIVIALVGERGREVAEFIEDGLNHQSRQRSIVVVSTSDRPANERLKASFVATAYAEHFSAQGKSVLLLVDSVTRLARAAREIGLASGEPATRRGFPASVFSMLPRLFERAGSAGAGAITALYTVLEESDDHTDPIAEEVRSLLDGTVSLSRSIAERGQFPAVDVCASVSRLMPRLVSGEQLRAASRARELLARYREVELLVRIGEYQRGVDATADAAIDAYAPLNAFLSQSPDEHTTPGQTLAMLQAALQ